MTRKREVGICHICGQYGALSFEHIPPRKAFNEKSVVRVKFEEAIELGPDQQIKGPIQQKGMGDYTLCSKCNNDTGSWYSSAFINWCYQGLEILIKSNGKPTLIYLNHLLPLRILKQIITMFFSVNGPGFAPNNLDLVKFILNRDMKYLNPKYRFFTYYNITGIFRTAGISSIVRVDGNKITLISEINYPPYGYVMTIDSGSPDPRLYEITYFSRYGYNEFITQALRLPVLPTYLIYPGDYRTKKEIIKEEESGQVRKGLLNT